MATTKPKTKKEKDVYEVTVGGTYITATRHGHLAQNPYKVTFKSPSAEKALSIFKGHIAPSLMPKRYPGFKRLKTHELLEIKNLTNPGKVPSDVRFMNEDQLNDEIAELGIPLKRELYPNLTELRTAVSTFMESPEAFDKYQERREKFLGETLALKYEAEELNKDLFSNPTEGVPESQLTENAQEY